MNAQNLNRGSFTSNITTSVGNAYERLTNSPAYKRNDNQLRVIQVAVVTVVVIS